MTWTFVPDYTLARDRIRSLVGDIDTTDQLVTDEFIALYTSGGVYAQANDYLAAAMVAEAIATKYTRLANSMSAGGTSVNWGDRAKNYTTLATSLRSRSARSSGVLAFAGGISIAAKQVQTDNTDNTVPAFTRGMGDTGTDRTTQPGEPEKYGYWG